ncbi:MAG: hypothetical protein ACK4YP_12955 [Myxococcota bacterium]
MLLLLVACVRLQEGDYTVDFAPVDVDTCDVYHGGEAVPDGAAAVSFPDGGLEVVFAGADDVLSFDLHGDAFSRESEGELYFEDSGACSFVTAQIDAGEVTSSTTFSVRTALTGVLRGDCEIWQEVFDDPCEIAFDWTGTLIE